MLPLLSMLLMGMVQVLVEKVSVLACGEALVGVVYVEWWWGSVLDSVEHGQIDLDGNRVVVSGLIGIVKLESHA